MWFHLLKISVGKGLACKGGEFGTENNLVITIESTNNWRQMQTNAQGDPSHLSVLSVMK